MRLDHQLQINLKEVTNINTSLEKKTMTNLISHQIRKRKKW
jgi:hypothetical protein